MKPIQHQSLIERRRRSAIQPDRKVHTTNKKNTEARNLPSYGHFTTGGIDDKRTPCRAHREG
jgi:hypothetical protein